MDTKNRFVIDEVPEMECDAARRLVKRIKQQKRKERFAKANPEIVAVAARTKVDCRERKPEPEPTPVPVPEPTPVPVPVPVPPAFASTPPAAAVKPAPSKFVVGQGQKWF